MLLLRILLFVLLISLTSVWANQEDGCFTPKLVQSVEQAEKWRLKHLVELMKFARRIEENQQTNQSPHPLTRIYPDDVVVEKGEQEILGTKIYWRLRIRKTVEGFYEQYAQELDKLITQLKGQIHEAFKLGGSDSLGLPQNMIIEIEPGLLSLPQTATFRAVNSHFQKGRDSLVVLSFDHTQVRVNERTKKLALRDTAFFLHEVAHGFLRYQIPEFDLRAQEYDELIELCYKQSEDGMKMLLLNAVVQLQKEGDQVESRKWLQQYNMRYGHNLQWEDGGVLKIYEELKERIDQDEKKIEELNARIPVAINRLKDGYDELFADLVADLILGPGTMAHSLRRHLLLRITDEGNPGTPFLSQRSNLRRLFRLRDFNPQSEPSFGQFQRPRETRVDSENLPKGVHDMFGWVRRFLGKYYLHDQMTEAEKIKIAQLAKQVIEQEFRELSRAETLPDEISLNDRFILRFTQAYFEEEGTNINPQSQVIGNEPFSLALPQEDDVIIELTPKENPFPQLKWVIRTRKIQENVYQERAQKLQKVIGEIQQKFWDHLQLAQRAGFMIPEPLTISLDPSLLDHESGEPIRPHSSYGDFERQVYVSLDRSLLRLNGVSGEYELRDPFVPLHELSHALLYNQMPELREMSLQQVILFKEDRRREILEHVLDEVNAIVKTMKLSGGQELAQQRLVALNRLTKVELKLDESELEEFEIHVQQELMKLSPLLSKLKAQYSPPRLVLMERYGELFADLMAVLTSGAKTSVRSIRRLNLVTREEPLQGVADRQRLRNSSRLRDFVPQAEPSIMGPEEAGEIRVQREALEKEEEVHKSFGWVRRFIGANYLSRDLSEQDKIRLLQTVSRIIQEEYQELSVHETHPSVQELNERFIKKLQELYHPSP